MLKEHMGYADPKQTTPQLYAVQGESVGMALPQNTSNQHTPLTAHVLCLQGESVGMALYMVGARPVKEGTGRIAR